MFNKENKFFMNPQRAKFSDRMNEGKPKPAMPGASKPMAAKPAETKAPGATSELSDNGDGTFHTKTPDGKEMDHEHIGHALMHIASKHAEGKHVHVHEDGMGMVSHHHMGHGDVQGPHEHGSADEAGDHVKDVMGDGMDTESDGPDLSMLGEEQ